MLYLAMFFVAIAAAARVKWPLWVALIIFILSGVL